jgi:glutamine amidotransferase
VCRLYGFHANEPTKVECSLVHAQNSLLIQSRGDERGLQHADGWGIAYYDEDGPVLEKGAAAAFDCLHFSDSAERVYANTVVAHVRLATVGSPSVLNCHPFRWRQWVFAHNGTVMGVEALRPRMLIEMGVEQARNIQGTTDSELLFHWLIAGFRLRHLIDNDSPTDVFKLQRTLGALLAELDERCQQCSPDKPAKLNVVLTNGDVLLASRLRNSLHWVHRAGLHDCEICGIPHVAHDSAVAYQAVVVASEPISHENWEVIPDGSVLAVKSDMSTRLLPIERTRRIAVKGG